MSDGKRFEDLRSAFEDPTPSGFPATRDTVRSEPAMPSTRNDSFLIMTHFHLVHIHQAWTYPKVDFQRFRTIPVHLIQS